MGPPGGSGPPPPWGGGPGGPGGYGPPPGGYGPPPGGPGGYGMAPMQPPQKKGPNIGLIIGLGCLGIFVIGGIVTVLLIYAGYRKAAAIAATLPTTTTKSISGGGYAPPTAPLGSLKAELKDLRDFKGDFGKARHFVGELYNTGDEALGFPTAKVTLYDAANTAIDSGTCASVVRVLAPGQKIPCFFSTYKTDSYSTYKTEITPMKSFYKGDLPEFGISDTKFVQKRGYSPYQLDGKITNKSSFKAKSVWALVSLYGADGKIVGAEQALVAGTDLEAGTSGLFSAKIYNVAAAPQTWNVIAVGYSE